jgi:hypothetical protein
METQKLADYGRIVQVMVGAATRMQVEEAVDRLVADKPWDFCGALLLSATELGARVLVARLLEAQVYAPLAVAAAMRREIKPIHMQQRKGAAARRVFRDLDSETDSAGVPDHIQAELDDLGAIAEEARDIADRREAQRDADPVRALIVNELGKAAVSSDEAMDALVAIVHAGAFEDTQGSAALKLITNPTALKRLSAAGRTADLVSVANCCGLDSAAQRVAETLAPDLDALVADRAKDALALIGKHHPDPAVRERAVEGGK